MGEKLKLNFAELLNPDRTLNIYKSMQKTKLLTFFWTPLRINVVPLFADDGEW